MKDLKRKSASPLATIRFHHFDNLMSCAKSGPYFFFRDRIVPGQLRPQACHGSGVPEVSPTRRCSRSSRATHCRSGTGSGAFAGLPSPRPPHRSSQPRLGRRRPRWRRLRPYRRGRPPGPPPRRPVRSADEPDPAAAGPARPLSETEPVPAPTGTVPNYLRWLSDRREQTEDYPGIDRNTILYALARHAARLADADAAVRFEAQENVATRKTTLKPELVDPSTTGVDRKS